MLKVLMITSGLRCGITDYTKKLTSELLKHKNIEIEISELKPGILRFYLLREIIKKKPDVIHVQHEIVMFDGFLGITSFVIYFYTFLTGKKVITTIHTVKSLKNFKNEIAEKYSRYSFLLIPVKTFLKYSFKTIGFFSEKIIVLTESSKKVLDEEYGIRNVEYIFHGFYKSKNVDEDMTRSIREELGIGPDETIILLFGFPFEKKGYHHVIRSLPDVITKHQGIKLVITGGISKADPEQSLKYLERLKKLSAELNVEKHVIFTGYMADEKIPALIETSRMAIFPFEDRQTASGSISTVYAYKKPMIVSDISTMDFLDDEVDCIKVKKGDEKKIASAIDRLMDDKDFYGKLRLNMSRRIGGRSLEDMAEKHLKIYEEIIN